MSNTIVMDRQNNTAASGEQLGRMEPPRLYVVGLNHTRASVEVREAYAQSPEQCAALHRESKACGLCDQMLVLSTCNRTEIYALSSDPMFSRRLRERFIELGSENRPDLGAPPIYEYSGFEAARHLFAVSSGLDSMILGENQIKQQLQLAYDLAREEGCAGQELHMLMQATNRCAKRIRTETELNVRTLDVGKAAVLKGETKLEGLEGKVCAVVGAGKAGRVATRAIAERKPARLLIFNRSIDKARELADEMGGEAHALEDLPLFLHELDFVLGAAAAKGWLLSAETYHDALGSAGCTRHRVCIVDIAVPRIFDPALSEVPWVRLYDIEQMEGIVEANRKERAKAAQLAWQLVEDEVEKYRAEVRQVVLGPVIRKLRREVDQVFAQETASIIEAVPEDRRKHVEASQRRIKQRVLHEAITQLKDMILD